jgi:NADPH:quinone reductase-like Zn-dependent oxidoreductase
MYIGNCELPQIGDNDVRVSVKAAAINPLDWQLRQGTMKLFTGRRFPKGMGTDFAGIVEAKGSKVANVQVGDEVFGTVDFMKSGAFAEAVVVQADHLAKKPSRLSFGEAASLPVAAMTAWVAIHDKANARAGARVFINGCSGAVGAFAVQLAVALGARVSGACGPASQDRARSAGVDEIFGYDDKQAYARDGKYDVVFDTLGTLEVATGISMLKPGGAFVDINPTPSRVLRGMLSRRYKLAFANTGIKHLQKIADVAENGALRPEVGVVAPFSNAVAVIADAERGAHPAGKRVLTF